MDFEAEGMLEGLSPRQRTARLELLHRLAADGFSPEQLREAVAEDRLALLPVDRVLAAQYTAAEVHELTGVPVELVLRIRRAGAGQHDDLVRMVGATGPHLRAGEQPAAVGADGLGLHGSKIGPGAVLAHADR